MGTPFKWKARHTILVILFTTWIVSFMDRMLISVAIPYIAADYHLSSLESGAVMSIFFAGYSISQIPGGWLADNYGIRRVATVAMLWWSIFTAVTGAAANFIQILIARFIFGLGEGVFPPCAFKAIAVWFPQGERATANAFMLASNPLGAALSPLVAVGIMSLWGWRPAFYSLFVPGVLIALLFWIFIRDQPSESDRISAGGLLEIGDGDAAVSKAPTGNVSYLQILQQPAIFKYFLVLFTFDVANWGFITWLPTYLVKARDFSMAQMGVAASLPFFAGVVGCVLGGWVSDRYFRKNRRIPIIATQVLSGLLLYVMFVAHSVVVLVVSQTLAGMFLNVFFSAFWALPMNTVPKSLMGVAGGLINMAGQLSAFIAPAAVGYLVESAGGNFGPAFIMLIVSVLISSVIVFTLPGKVAHHREGAAHG